MKISRYTFFFHIDNVNYYTYNSLSNALIEIDEKTYFYLKENENKTELSDIALNKDAYNLLLKNGILTDNDEDDLLSYKDIIKKKRNQTKFMHLTLAPTMDCCFNCFETCKDRKYMSSETIDSIIKYIQNQINVIEIMITWFGGEPLMALEQMVEFNEKLSKIYPKSPNYHIITTGYHIDENVIEKLKNIGINSIQITIDGMKETHNKVKYLPDCNDVFSKVWNNIKLLHSLAANIKITIRVNLTKGNIHEYKQLLKLFNETFTDKNNIVMAPSFVINRGTIHDNSKSTLFTPKERSIHILKLAHEGIYSPYIKYPNNSFAECAIRNNVAISFDPERYAYKCWEVIGDKKYAIGRLNSQGELIELNKKNINRQLYGGRSIRRPHL